MANMMGTTVRRLGCEKVVLVAFSLLRYSGLKGGQGDAGAESLVLLWSKEGPTARSG